MAGFDSPGSVQDAGSDTRKRIVWDEVANSLLVIEPGEVKRGIVTKHGDKDALRATVHVLDGFQQGASYVDVLIFSQTLMGQCTGKSRVLGRLKRQDGGMGWELADYTQDDLAKANQWDSKADTPPF